MSTIPPGATDPDPGAALEAGRPAPQPEMRPPSPPGFRRAGIVAVWLGGTVLAMLLATAAVQLAGAKVTQRPAATVSRSQIDTELARHRDSVAVTSVPEVGAPAATASPDAAPAEAGVPTTPPAPGPSAGAAPRAGGAPTTLLPAVPGPAAPAPTTVPPRAGSPTTVAPAPVGREAAPTPTPTPVPTTTAPSSQQTFPLTGGTVVVRCVGDAAQRISSNPAPGYTMDIRNSGPQEVDVRFESSTHRSELKATCAAGTAVGSIEESARSGDSDPLHG